MTDLQSYEDVLANRDTALALYTDGTHFTFRTTGLSSSGRWRLDTSRSFAKVLIYRKSDCGGEIYLGDYYDTITKGDDDYYFVRFKNGRSVGSTNVLWTNFTKQPNGRSQRIYLPRSVSVWADPSEEEVHVEGAIVPVLVNKFERDPKARAKCIKHHGCVCVVCQIDFSVRYGNELGAGFIHVHHLRYLSRIRKSYVVDPIRDLIPVCPNCHAMLHRGNLSPTALRRRIKQFRELGT